MKSDLKLPEALVIELNDDELSYIKTMAQDIYDVPAKRRGRTLETVMAHTTAGVRMSSVLPRYTPDLFLYFFSK